jgi:hypothetical protein
MLPIDRTSKSSLDANLVNGNTSDAPVIKSSNDVVYNTIDELYNYSQSLITTGTLSPYPPANYNKFINGNFDLWQRGTSIAARNSYGPDRWTANDDGGSPLYTVSQQLFTPGQTEVPNEPKYYTKIAVSALSAGSIAFGQKIEDVRNFAGKKITLSFYAKADIATSQASASGFQIFGAGGSSQTSLGTSSIQLTTSWSKFIITFTVPSILGKTIGNNNDSFLFIQPLRISPTAPITNYYISQVQINVGDQALPFQPRSFAEEVSLCLRYYEKSYDYEIAPGTNSNNGLFMTTSLSAATASGTRWPLGSQPRFRVEKRVVPTVSLWSNTGTAGQWIIGGINQASSTSSYKTSFWLLNNTGASVTPAASETYGHWSADAEL